jgi:hypothetical protein
VFVFKAPCDVNDHTGLKSACVKFDANTAGGSAIYSLPFDGTNSEIEVITKHSNMLDNDQLNKYFALEFKTLVLKTHYELSDVEINYIEILFTCVPKSVESNDPNATSSSLSNESLSITLLTKENSSHLSQQTFLLNVTIQQVNDEQQGFMKKSSFLSEKKRISVDAIEFKNKNAAKNELFQKKIKNKNSYISYEKQCDWSKELKPKSSDIEVK